jgi:hypothetical protein
MKDTIKILLNSTGIGQLISVLRNKEVLEFIGISFSLLFLCYLIIYLGLLTYSFITWTIPNKFPIPFIDHPYLDRALLLFGVFLATLRVFDNKD